MIGSKKMIIWKNKTCRHPNGVCEGATSKWLFSIGAEGIEEANKIKPQDCDELQDMVEKANFSWSTDLKLKWAEYVKDKADLEFEPFGDEKSSTCSTLIKSQSKESVMSLQELSGLLSKLTEGDFGYINAIQPTGNGHALAIYRSKDNIYFFDPYNAIYNVSPKDADTLSKQIFDNVKSWEDVVIFWGKITRTGLTH
ncbi:hypothetical protein [Nostoc sp.]|uniref:hypothetical protein n=1 Tax=Nostoc sp. TaxID=1180 RepID=UPI002FFD0DF4